MNIPKKILIIMALSLVLLGIFLGYALRVVLDWYQRPVILPQQELILEIKPGQSFKQVIRQLAQKNLVYYPYWLMLAGELTGWSKQIKAGYYQFGSPTTTWIMVRKIVTGDIMETSFRIGEGWSVRRILQELAKHAYIKHTLDPELAPEKLADVLKLPLNNAEGVFFPDTYKFAAGMSDRELLKRSYRVLDNKLSQFWQNRAHNLSNLSPYEVLILASIIEKETAMIGEKARIAGVLLQRLKKNMRLQADPTVIYALGDKYQGRLVHQDLSFDSPFNTYLHSGLPPAPIGTISNSSLLAALHPEEVDYLYYVSMQNGQHYFARNLAEHNQAVKKYLKKKNEDQKNKPQLLVKKLGKKDVQSWKKLLLGVQPLESMLHLFPSNSTAIYTPQVKRHIN